MRKKCLAQILGLLLTLNVASGAEAAQINTIIDTGSGMFAEPEKVYKEIDETINSWFNLSAEEMKKLTFKERMALKSNGEHTLVPAADSDAIVQIYREEKGIAVSSDQMVTGMQVRDTTMTKEDMANLCTELGADYIIYFRVTNTMPTMTSGFMSIGMKTNVTTDFRVWSAKEARYTYAKRYITTGSSSSFYMGVGSASNAVKDGLEKALEQIDEDKAAIVASIQ